MESSTLSSTNWHGTYGVVDSVMSFHVQAQYRLPCSFSPIPMVFGSSVDGVSSFLSKVLTACRDADLSCEVLSLETERPAAGTNGNLFRPEVDRFLTTPHWE